MLRKLLGLSHGLAYWSGVAGKGLREAGVARILLYHGTVESSVAALGRQLAYLKRHFMVVPLAELVERLERGDALGRRVAITFDDGLRNNVTVAYPLLRRLGAPATFFVCPGLIEAGRWLWNHEARQRLWRLPDATSKGVEETIERLKNLPLAERQDFEERLRRATPAFRATAEERHAFDLAGWEELRRLDPAVVSVQSHTVSHAILPTLQTEACERELEESRRMIEERLQRPAPFFAYPNGDCSSAVREAAGRHYRAAVLAAGGVAAAHGDLLALPRVAAPPGALRLATAVHRAAAQTGNRPAPVSPAPARTPCAAPAPQAPYISPRSPR